MGKATDDRLWQQAVSFAAQRHQGQYRKDGKTPYLAHLVRVALVVRHVFDVNDQTALIAALCHDLIEDTTTDYDDVIELFGKEVADAVAALTKDSRLPEPEREEAYDRQLTTGNRSACPCLRGRVSCEGYTVASEGGAWDERRVKLCGAGGSLLRRGVGFQLWHSAFKRDSRPSLSMPGDGV